MKIYYAIVRNILFEVEGASFLIKKYLDLEFKRIELKNISDHVIILKIKAIKNLLFFDKIFLGMQGFFNNEKSTGMYPESILLGNSFKLQYFENHTILFLNQSVISFRWALLRIIYPIIQYYLNKNNYLLIKASCVSKENKAFMFSAPSGGGKTTFVLNMISEDYKYVSDTITFVNTNGWVYNSQNAIHVFNRNIDHLKIAKKYIKYYYKSYIELALKNLLYIITFRKYSLSVLINIKNNCRSKDEWISVKNYQFLGNNYNNQIGLAKLIILIMKDENSFFNDFLSSARKVYNIYPNYWERFSNTVYNFTNSTCKNFIRHD